MMGQTIGGHQRVNHITCAAGFDRKEDALIALIHVTCVKCQGELHDDYYHFNQFNHFSHLGCNVEGARRSRALSSQTVVYREVDYSSLSLH